MSRKLFLLFIAAGISAFLSAEEYTVESNVMWQESRLIIDVTYPLQVSQKPLPAIKKQIENRVSDHLKEIIFNELAGVILDSHTKVSDYMDKNPDAVFKVYNLSDSAKREYSLFARDMKSVKIRYSISLYPDIAGIFISGAPHEELDRILKFVPSADFSGIVIYVKKLTPYFRKEGEGMFTPSLFPRIYDQRMNLVMDRFHVSPESILKWGTTGFRRDLDYQKNLERIGHNPLKITARGLFGINNTDIIISNREAEKILAREENINLIYEGRILIVY